ncbi:flagellar brake domain-containing protein [Clostridium sp.]|uniref:flagellar brake protein n=1 Tax=Clostridium sp. TaxID=1506 RepID=UPI0032175018
METNITMEINNKLEVYTEDNKLAKSIIQEVDNDSISIAMPIYMGINYPLLKGNLIECNYNDGKGNIYRFTAEVIGRKFDRIPMIVISKKSELEKIQRRDFVRIPFINEIGYAIIDKYNERMLHDIEKVDYKSGKSLDLSGGGMRIKIKESLNLNQLIMIKTEVNNKPVLALGKVARIENSQGDEHVYGMAFKYIDNKVREEIIKFIFQNMRKSMKTK